MKTIETDIGDSSDYTDSLGYGDIDPGVTSCSCPASKLAFLAYFCV